MNFSNQDKVVIINLSNRIFLTRLSLLRITLVNWNTSIVYKNKNGKEGEAD